MLKSKKDLWLLPAESIAVFIAITAIVYILTAAMNFAPFGENSLAIWDANIQYLDFFAYLKRVLTGDSSIIYTFESTLGNNNIAVFSYYLSSPLNIIVLFFEQKDFSAMFTLLAALKFALAGAFFAVFLYFRFKSIKPVFVCLLSICYGLSQFSLAQASNIMWLDGVYMLPLILLGTYMLVKDRRNKLPLIISVACSILFNWYSGGINCIFCICYYFYEDSLKNKFSGLKEYVCRTLPYIACMLLGVLISLCLFLPTMLALRGGRAGLDTIEQLVVNEVKLKDLLSIVTRFKIGGTSEFGKVSLYCGYLAFVGCGAYFFTKPEETRCKKITAIFLIICVSMFFISPFIAAYSLFKRVESYWYRYSYIGIFTILLISARYFEKVGNVKINITAGKFVVATLLFILCCLDWGEHSYFAALSFIFVCAVTVMYNKFLQHDDGKQLSMLGDADSGRAALAQAIDSISLNKKIYKILLIVLAALLAVCTVTETCINASALMKAHSINSVSYYSEYVTQQQQQVSELKNYDDGFYRISQTDTRNKDSSTGLTANYNESLAYGYNSINGYTSDPSDISRTFLAKLGYRINGANMNIVNTSVVSSDALLGVKYVFSSYDINGLQKIDSLPEHNGKNTYLNPYALPMSFKFNPRGLSISEGNMFDYQNSLYSYLSGEDVTIYHEAETEKITDESGNITYKVKVPEAPHALYADFEIATSSHAPVSINGGNSTNMGGWTSPNVLYIPDNGDDTTVYVDMSSSTSCTCRIYWLDLNALSEVTQNLQNGDAEMSIENGHVEGTVTANDGEKLYLSVPYEDGWSITVNGKSAHYELIGGCMIAVTLEEGLNNVELNFSAPGLLIGILISVFALILSGLIFYTDYRNKRLRDLLPLKVREAGNVLYSKILGTYDTSPAESAPPSSTEHRSIFKKIWDSSTTWEIARFIIVGGIATIADFITMSIVLYAMQPAIYPNILSIFLGGTSEPSTLATILGTSFGFLAGLIINYFLSIAFVYNEKGKSKTLKGFLLFFILSAGGLLIHILGMYVGFDVLHINEWIVKIVLTIIVLIYNYITKRLIIFKRSVSENDK